MIVAIFCLIICSLWAGPVLGAKKDCFQCHSRRALLKGNVHPPAARGECLKCHLPHVSRYPKLLTQESPELCFTCHKKLSDRLQKAPFIHGPVAKGACRRCHEAHASSQKNLLKKDPKILCFSCHKEANIKYARPHAPFAKGRCLSCHEAHYAENRLFLKKKGSSLCFSCHRNTETLARIHKVKNVKGLDCLSCHNPHGGPQKGLLRSFRHPPYAQGKCQTCHQNLKAGSDMCFKCHPKTRSDFYHQHNHLLGGYEENACLICHAPHVASNKEFLRDKPRRLCQRCHAETARQRAESLYIHPKWKECLACHLAHGSDSPSMLNGDGNAVCVRCHETQGKFTHPVGEKVRDPRNGQPITCVTCHNPMGTNFKYNLRLSGEASLCLECHKNY